MPQTSPRSSAWMWRSRCFVHMTQSEYTFIQAQCLHVWLKATTEPRRLSLHKLQIQYKPWKTPLSLSLLQSAVCSVPSLWQQHTSEQMFNWFTTAWESVISYLCLITKCLRTTFLPCIFPCLPFSSPISRSFPLSVCFFFADSSMFYLGKKTTTASPCQGCMVWRPGNNSKRQMLGFGSLTFTCSCLKKMRGARQDAGDYAGQGSTRGYVYVCVCVCVCACVRRLDVYLSYQQSCL